MVNRWKVLLAAVVIFAAGAATGGLVTRSLLPRQAEAAHAGPPLPVSKDKRMDYVTKLDRQVQLTPEQREQVEKIIAASQQRMKQIWQSVEPQVKEEYKCSRQEVSQVLTSEQLEKMKKWQRERHARRAGSRTNNASRTNSSVP